MVKSVKKPVVTNDEQRYRDELYPDVKSVKNKNILCTSCNGSLKELILKGKPNIHPFMDTLLCEKCYLFFGDGEFSVDEDGSDKYCRWCGQGGTLYLCSTCTAGFCKKCIKRNLPRAALKEVEKDDWKCFCCDVKPLYELRAHCWAANKFAAEFVRKPKVKKTDEQEDWHSEDSDESSELKKRYKDDDSDEEKSTRKYSRRGKRLDNKKTSRESEDSDESSGKRKRNKNDESDEEKGTRKSSKRLKKANRDSEDSDGSGKEGQRNRFDDSNDEKETVKPIRRGKRTYNKKATRGPNEKTKIYKPIITKFAATIKDALSMTDLFKKKALDCLNKKIKLKYMKDRNSVEDVFGKIDTLLLSVENISKELRASSKEYLDEWKQDLGGQDDKGQDEDRIDEPSTKIADEKKTVNGIDEKKSSDEDHLVSESKAQDDASDESEHCTKAEDQNKVNTPDLSNVTSRTNKGNSGSEDPDIGTVENQKEDSDGKSETDVLTSGQKEENQTSSDKVTSLKKKLDDTDDDFVDVPTEEMINKKFKSDSGDEDI